jgi:nucleoside-diphosphate-sugar epimerase
MHYIPEIGPETDWTQAVSSANIVVHLAARVHLMKDKDIDPLAAYRRVNTEGTKALATQAAAAGVKRFVFVSTVKVIGEVSPDGGFTESSPAEPKDAYSMSKWEAEQGLIEISKTTGMEVVILRPPLVYGRCVKGNFLTLLKIIKNGIPLPFKSIRNKRSLIYVGNLVDAIGLTLEHPDAANQTYFVSDAEVTSTSDLIKIIAYSLGKNPRLIRFPRWIMEFIGASIGKSGMIQRTMGSLCVNTRHIENQLKWRPPYTMEDGIMATVNWFNENSLK